MRQELLSKQGSEIRGMFGRIAHRYDLLNRVLSLGQDVGWRKKVALRVAAADPERVLDVCTGTGDLALAMDETTVIGADFCLPMLGVAQSKISSSGRTLPLCAADALHLPIALWLTVGYAYIGGRWNDHYRRMDFVRFSGEWFIYYILIVLI